MNPNDRYAKEFENAKNGGRTNFLRPEELVPFVSYVVARGYGICRMESITEPNSAGNAKNEHDIIKLDGDDAWTSHFDPERSLELVRKKLA